MLNDVLRQLMLTCSLASVSLVSVAQVTMNIDATKRGPMISDYQYGLFFEEINHAGDGGLYAELVRNRSFEDASSPDYWNAYKSTTSQTVSFSLTSSSLLNSAQSKALYVRTSGATEANKVGVYNEGFWGMKFVTDSTYTLSLWVKAVATLDGSVYAQLQDVNGNALSAETQLSGSALSSSQWVKLTATIKATGTAMGNGRLAILFAGNGAYNIDVVSLMPYTWKGRANGCRPDLAQLLYDTNPTFLRFPGGCYVEGQGTFDDAFQWKKTLGPIEERPGHWNNNWGYRSSDGLGYHEYLQLCEDLEAAPMFVVNVGMGHGFTVPFSVIDTLVQNTLDAIEYANGDASTKWGAMRIANGHPEPFNLKFLEVGNENGQVEVRSEYGPRYIEFYNAIKEKYPDIVIIGNVEAWGTDYPSWGFDYPVDLVDEHYYRSYSWMTNNYDKYDRYPRTIGVYNGEYAANDAGTYGTYGNMNSALGESIYMLGMEKNSDVCKLASFAPIFTHESNPTWPYDMIHFNAASVFCTPSYYVQKLLAQNLGKQNLLWTETGNSMSTASYKIGLGSWNTTVSYDDVSVTDGTGNTLVTDDFSSANSAWTVTGGTWAVSDGVLSQSASITNCVDYNTTGVGDTYIYKVRARKNSGGEGFLIIFNYQDANNYCWWNLGGWNNTVHGVEQCVNGSKTTVASASGTIETDRWYDIEIRVSGNSVTCLLDGTTVHQFTLSTSTTRRIYQSVQIDEENGVMYLKVTNPTAEATTLNLNLINIAATSGTVVRLASASGLDENTMDNPNNVMPTEETALSSVTQLEIPAYSLNIFKLNVTDVAAETEDGVLDEDADKYGYLYAHMNSSSEITNYALSRYGLVWNDLFGSGEAFDTDKFTTTGGMRDAYICRTENGKFIYAGTDMTSRLGWTSNHIMSLMLSNDLVHWDKYVSIDLESAENLAALGLSSASEMTAAWAPQVIYDPVTKKYMVYYSVGFPDRHRIYYSLMNEDLTEITLPKVLFDPGYDIIDADIVWNELDSQYVMIYKTESGSHYLKQATAKYLVPTAGNDTGTCQWEINESFQVVESGMSIEAPSLFRPIGSKTWKLAYMNYSGGGYRMMDLDEHCLNPEHMTNMQGEVAPQHGSFLKITEREYKHLETWDALVTMLTSAKSLNASNPLPALTTAIETAEKALEESGTFDEEYAAMQEAYANLSDAYTNYEEYMYQLAREGKLENLTFMLVNPDFSEGSQGWSGTAFTAASSGVAEHYYKTFDFYQELTGMPDGKYRLAVQSFYRAGSIEAAYASHILGVEEINPVMYLNDSEQKVVSLFSTDFYTYSPYTYPNGVGDANTAFNTNDLYHNQMECEVTGGTLRVGMKSETMIPYDWCCFDNFKLYYLDASTGIESVSTDSRKDGRIYNLMGVELQAEPQGGVYIRNGKKYVK